MKTLLALVTTVALGVSTSLAAPEVGKPAPDFTLQDTNGNALTLSDHKGSYIVLEWINHGCPFVKKFYSSGKMQEFQAETAKKGVKWLTICSSAPGEQGHMDAKQWNAKIRETESKPTATLLDEDGKVGKAYGAKVTPHMYVINPEGTLIYAGAIDSIRSTSPEDIAKADNYVMKALEEAMAGKEVSTPSTKPYGCGVKY
jgi:peroxiredoxin